MRPQSASPESLLAADGDVHNIAAGNMSTKPNHIANPITLCAIVDVATAAANIICVGLLSQ